MIERRKEFIQYLIAKEAGLLFNPSAVYGTELKN
jgi:hypothetical protein